MADESVDARLERLMRETGTGGAATATPDEVEQRLNQNMGYQLKTGPERVLQRKEAFAEHGMEPPTSISSPGKKELNEQGPVHKYVRPALEMGGMMGGAVLGAALPPPFTGPIGGALGGTLGYAGGDTLASLAERIAGERPPVQSVEQAIGETARSVTGGGALEMGSRIVGKGLGSVISKAAAPFAKQYEGASKTLDEMAQSKGIQLDPHEILQSRPVALAHKTLENIPFTSGMIQRKELEKVAGLTKEWTRIREATGTKDRQRLGDIGQKIQDTVEKELDRIGIRQGEIRDAAREKILSDSGSPLTYKALGEQTQQSIKELHEGKKALENAAWDFARRDIPTARIEPNKIKTVVGNIEKEYEGLSSIYDPDLKKVVENLKSSGNPLFDAKMDTLPKGVTPENFSQMSIRAQKAIIGDIGPGEEPGWTLQQMQTLRSGLSDLIEAHHTGIQRGDVTKGTADKTGRFYTQLIKAIDEDIGTFGDAHGSEIQHRLNMARAASGARMAFFNPKENPAVMKSLMADPETLASLLITPGNAAGYTELKNLAGENAVKPVKQAFTNKLLNVGGQGEEGLPSLRRRLDQVGAQTIAEVYTPQEAKNIYHLADQSRWMKQSPIGNPLFRELVKESPKSVAPTILGHTDLTAKVLRQFPQMRNDLRAAFLEGLHPNQMTPFPTQMLKHLNAYPADVQKQLFSNREIRDFYDLAQIVERSKGSVKLAENPAGTAQGLISFATGSAVLHHPITMAPKVLGTAALARLYLSPMGRRFLLEGLRPPISPERSLYVSSQILGVAGMDAVRDATEP